MDIDQIRRLADTTNPDSARVKAACLELLPTDPASSDDAELLYLYAEAMLATDPNRRDNIAPLADRAWRLAADNGDYVLAVRAFGVYMLYVGRTLGTLERYMEYVNVLSELRDKWYATAELVPGQRREIDRRLSAIGHAGYRLVEDRVLTAPTN